MLFNALFVEAVWVAFGIGKIGSGVCVTLARPILCLLAHTCNKLEAHRVGPQLSVPALRLTATKFRFGYPASRPPKPQLLWASLRG